MKKSVKIGCFVVLVAVVMLSLAFCNLYEGPYIFWRQDRANIAKIEICSYDHMTWEREVISEIPKEDIDEVIDEISSFISYEFIGDHPYEYSPIMICVTYSDGEIELISFHNIGYISTDGKQHITSRAMHSHSGKKFYNLICRYVDSEDLPENIAKYLEFYKNLPDNN